MSTKGDYFRFQSEHQKNLQIHPFPELKSNKCTTPDVESESKLEKNLGRVFPPGTLITPKFQLRPVNKNLHHEERDDKKEEMNENVYLRGILEET